MTKRNNEKYNKKKITKGYEIKYEIKGIIKKIKGIIKEI